MTYAIVSDIHAHGWTNFATTEADGVNSRLRIILNELQRAVSGLMLCGGSTLIIAGDIFHVRGMLDPEVLNPVQKTIQWILDQGVNILAIPGNHDLKGSDTTELGSAIQTLAATASTTGASMTVFNEMTSAGDGRYVWGFVPWRHSTDALLDDLARLKRLGRESERDVIIHAGIDGVIPGLDHGISPQQLIDFGFKRVFAGHYHNHKDIGSGIYSIGALTHQTWSDIGSKAGFLFVDENSVNYQASHAPEFVDVSGMTEEEIDLRCDGNYVRFRGNPMSSSDLGELRKHFVAKGALGTSIQVPKAAATVRPATAVAAGLTLDQSVAGFIDTSKDIPAHIDRAAVHRKAQEVLTASRAVYEES